MGYKHGAPNPERKPYIPPIRPGRREYARFATVALATKVVLPNSSSGKFGLTMP
jgi:hypothetical protein